MYIWKTERWEIFISENREIFKTSFTIPDGVKEKIETENWEANKKIYKEKFEEILDMICP